MSNPSYSPSFDETGPLVPPTGDDLNARTSAAVPDPNVEPALTSDDDDTLLTSDPTEDAWVDSADEDSADEILIEVDEQDEDDDDLDDFDDLGDDELDDDDDQDFEDDDEDEDEVDLDDELEDELDDDEDALEEEEFEEAAQIERDIAADTEKLGRDDGDGGIGRSLSDTQPL